MLLGTSNNSNGMNAFRAHQARTENDVTFTRNLIESYTFIGFGTVIRYTNERVDVSCGDHTFTNVEVMVFGVDGWGIKPVPAQNDRVLLIASQAPIPDLKKFEAPGSMPSYDASGIKAIPITDSDTAQLFTVDKDGVILTGDNKITINSDGIQVEDGNGNKVTTSENGIVVEDCNGDDDKHNKITTSSEGIIIEDCNYDGDKHSKITMASAGITIDDKNGNKIVTSSTGVSIEDKNGCKIVSTSSSVKINDKLEVKKQ